MHILEMQTHLAQNSTYSFHGFIDAPEAHQVRTSALCSLLNPAYPLIWLLSL